LTARRSEIAFKDSEEIGMAGSIERSVHIEAPVDVVWRIVTERGRIVRWFADEIDLQATPGYEGTMTFRPESGGTVQVPIMVETVEAPHRFTYRWTHPAGTTASPANSTLVEFTLAPEDGGTRLRVVETGHDGLGWPQDQQDAFADDHTEGWSHHLRRLEQLFARRSADAAR
jgi:uncharacterized protein YndB with AHSA1/START domain